MIHVKFFVIVSCYSNDLLYKCMYKIYFFLFKYNRKKKGNKFLFSVIFSDCYRRNFVVFRAATKPIFSPFLRVDRGCSPNSIIRTPTKALWTEKIHFLLLETKTLL